MKTIVKVGTEIHSDPHFLFFGLGSCFVQNLENHIYTWGKSYMYNPFGTSFNPISIADQLRAVLQPDHPFSIHIEHQNVHHDLAAANVFQSLDKAHLTSIIQAARTKANNFINQYEGVHLILSFGTAHAWFYKDQIVNNCHKLPGQFFERKLLSLDQMIKHWSEVLPLLPPTWNIIYTVSPVKYTKIGLQENFLGKSQLRLLIEALLPLREKSYYFPSYEIITDELRDYSFWKENGTHPNNQSVEIVMERFKGFLSL